MNLSRAFSGQLMAVKTLKNILWESFLILANHKLIFVTYKSVWIKTEPTFFLMQSKLIWLAALYSNYLIYDFKSHIWKILRITSYHWFLVKSYYIILILRSSIGLGKALSGSWIKSSEKSLWFKWHQHFLLSLF